MSKKPAIQAGTDILGIETHNLRCDLTLDQQRERGRELAHVSTNLGSLKNAHKASKAVMKKLEDEGQARCPRSRRA